MRAAYTELDGEGAARPAASNVRIDGVLVCEMVTGGVETVVGVSQDPLFGPVVMAGLGGIFVEVLERRHVPGPAVRRDRGRSACSTSSPGFKMLDGVRGAKPADVDALVDVIMKVSAARARPRRRDRRARHQPAGRPPTRRGRPRCIGGAQASDPDNRRADAEADESCSPRSRTACSRLTINRADSSNAIPFYVRDRLIQHFQEAHADLAVRAIVLTGAGERHFCTGSDLRIRPPMAPKPEGAPDMVVGTARPHDAHRVPAR